MERRLGGRYELREQLGDSTWLAGDLELGRDVVVRFGEVVGATLQHPAIARVFDQGEEAGERYAVLEYLPGGTLAERGALTEESAAGLAAALAYAHGQGVVHGALGPEAVLFDAEGRAKLTAFNGAGDPDADLAALSALRSEYAATEVRAPVEAATAVVPPPPPPAEPERRRWAIVAAVLAALVLVAAGIGAALVAGDDDDGAGVTVTTDPITSATIPTDTDEEPAPPPTTTADETTTTATTDTEPATTDTQPPTTATVAPPAPTEPPLPSIPATTEVPTEPVTTVQEPPPPTTTTTDTQE